MPPDDKISRARERTLTEADYIRALRELAPLSPSCMRMLQFHHRQPARTTTHKSMAAAMGWGPSAANLHYGKLGHRVGERLDWSPKFKVKVLAHFVDPNRERRCHWKMRGRLAGALEALGWVADAPEFDLMPGEMPDGTQLFEGAVRRVAVNAYERNPEARRICLAHYGTSCIICGFDFEAAYGSAAEGFIHVHHIQMIKEIGKKHVVDPVKDLRPVCPNCHSVIHLDTPAYSIDEVKAMLAAQRRCTGIGKTPRLDPPEVREARLRQPVVGFSKMTPKPSHQIERVNVQKKRVAPD